MTNGVMFFCLLSFSSLLNGIQILTLKDEGVFFCVTTRERVASRCFSFYVIFLSICPAAPPSLVVVDSPVDSRCICFCTIRVSLSCGNIAQYAKMLKTNAKMQCAC